MMKDFKITKHFSFFELTDSSEHPDLVEENRFQALKKLDILLDLCVLVLEPVRLVLNSPIIVDSGYRSIKLNKAVGGSLTSQHPKAEAADFRPKLLTIDEAYTKIIKSKVNYGQLINEYSRWIHISLGFPYRDTIKSNINIKLKGKR